MLCTRMPTCISDTALCHLLTVIQGKELELIASVRAGNLLHCHMDAMYLGWEYGAGVCVANNSHAT